MARRRRPLSGLSALLALLLFAWRPTTNREGGGKRRFRSQPSAPSFFSLQPASYWLPPTARTSLTYRNSRRHRISSTSRTRRLSTSASTRRPSATISSTSNRANSTAKRPARRRQRLSLAIWPMTLALLQLSMVQKQSSISLELYANRIHQKAGEGTFTISQLSIDDQGEYEVRTRESREQN